MRSGGPKLKTRFQPESNVPLSGIGGEAMGKAKMPFTRP